MCSDTTHFQATDRGDAELAGQGTIEWPSAKYRCEVIAGKKYADTLLVSRLELQHRGIDAIARHAIGSVIKHVAEMDAAAF